MVIIEFIRWWYGRGWRQYARSAAGWLRRLSAAFSVGLLVRTLFAPWKRLITYGDGSPAGLLRSSVDNLISRFVGFGVRVCVLVAAAVCLTLGAIAAIAGAVAWPLAPIAGLVMITAGVIWK